ncbi:hypothetical protein [Serratia sp. 2C06]|uniref:hypothetical protein n=1 Tax=Serratia sp. 2C06 TaxID=3416180 RepID=UPI003CED8A82
MKQSINTAAKGSPDDWDVKACLFVTQEIGRFSVKFSAPCIGGTVNLNCSHITNACNRFDAVARFVRETRAQGCTVYAVEQLEPVRPVCLSTTGYRFMQKASSGCVLIPAFSSRCQTMAGCGAGTMAASCLTTAR